MNASRIMAALAAALTLATNKADAAPVTQEQAQKAVQTLISREANPLGAKVGGRAGPARTFRHGQQDTPLFHVVTLEGGGFVVTSADTGITPIIAVSEGADLIASEENPLWTLLNLDLPQRMDALNAPAAKQAAPRGGNGAPSAEQLWASLLEEGNASKAAGEGSPSISDVRVAPLLQSKWGQSTVSGKNVFNYYTPYNYVCGCIATAGAQIMRYHRYPTGNVTPATYNCWVDGAAYSFDMKGGVYDWANMPLEPTSGITDVQREAIGRLTYDIGVASRMSWRASSSSTSDYVMVDILKTRFGYASAVSIVTLNDAGTDFGAPSPASRENIRNALLGTLDAELPAVLGLRGSKGGHGLIADGYGYHSGTLYAHLNLGWGGLQDAWYNLQTLDVSTTYNFTLIDILSFNIAPTADKAGEWITGRVLNSSNTPLSGATVTARNIANSATYTAVSNAKGIYAVKVPSSSASYDVSAATGSLSSSPKRVSVQPSVSLTYSWSGSSAMIPNNRRGSAGNSWGNDLTLAGAAATYTVTLDPNGGSGGTASVTATVGSPMPSATAPTRSGQTFQGYFDTSATSGGTQYYTAAMASARSWDKAQNATLWARWTQNASTTYTVTLDRNGGSGGTASVTATVGSPMPSATAPTRSGQTFQGYFDTSASSGGTQYYTAAMASARNWDKAQNATLWARWASAASAVHDFAFYKSSDLPSEFFLSKSAASKIPATTFRLGEPIHIWYAFWDMNKRAFNGSMTNAFRVVINGETKRLTQNFTDYALPASYYSGFWSEGYAWPAVQNLAPGTYTLTCTLNDGNLVPETNYANNERSITFRVTDPAQQGPCLSEPDGAGAAPRATTAYDGFLYDEDTSIVRGTMTLSAKVDKKDIWTFSAKAVLQNVAISFSGKFTGAGRFRVETATASLDVYVEGDRFHGWIWGPKVGGAFKVDGARNVFADKKGTPATMTLPGLTGLYNVALMEGSPMGYLSLSVGAGGAVKIAGRLADDSPVSGSAKLLDGLSDKGWYAIALHNPVNAKKGFVSGLLWLNPEDTTIHVDTDYGWYVNWQKSPDSTRHRFDVIGSRFRHGNTVWSVPNGLKFYADVPPSGFNLLSPLVRGGWVSQAFPNKGLPVTVNSGQKLSLPKATPPKQEKGASGYDYSGANPSGATISYAVNTGVFKGSFKLYCDGEDAKGKFQHKTASASYTGVMVLDGNVLRGIGTGLATINKDKFRIPVRIE